MLSIAVLEKTTLDEAESRSSSVGAKWRSIAKFDSNSVFCRWMDSIFDSMFCSVVNKMVSMLVSIFGSDIVVAPRQEMSIFDSGFQEDGTEQLFYLRSRVNIVDRSIRKYVIDYGALIKNAFGCRCQG